ncbi:hypothetical protein DCAR_0727629 [Daucus carota subsp. sativus]|uniref:hAT-like transposase RNase-H fold domain-containing protein n=1 Tax=Daucus carota subsp. sativus TaxID=79200 RepID=A0AAF0XJJ5_DAUCS|nr:hypothetical protein DCAR_0727629 [Daucus carota subsp. sativus]
MGEDISEKGSRKRKKKTSKVWEEFEEVMLQDGTKKLDCKYCHAKLSVSIYCSTNGLAVIEPIIHNVRAAFSEIVKNMQLPGAKKLILDVPTRWNSTYSMLECALQFKNVFPIYKKRDLYFPKLPTQEEWKVAEKIMKFLEVFNEATMVFSTSEYLTANLFSILDKSDYMQAMAHKMREKFEKYWGHCKLLMSIASILNLRYKMHFFEVNKNLTLVENTIRELFNEYIASDNS